MTAGRETGPTDSRLSRRLFERLTGIALPPAPGPVRAGDDLPPPPLRQIGAYLLRRGAEGWLRGLLVRARLGACGGRLFVGRGARLHFAGRIFLGRGVVLGERCVVNGLSRRGVRLGDRVRLQDGVRLQATSVLSEIGEGIEIGDDTYVGPGSFLGAGGGIAIGKRCLLGASVDLLAENHRCEDPERPIREQGVSRRGIAVGDDVWIGNKAVVLDGVRIGEGAVIGAASVVTRDVPSFAVVAGNPARLLRTRRPDRSGEEAVFPRSSAAERSVPDESDVLARP